MAIQASAFDTWIVYPNALARIARSGQDVRWFGTSSDLPSDGIKGACWDDATQALWLRSRLGFHYRWSEAARRASRETTPPACNSQRNRPLTLEQVPNLVLDTDGWGSMGGDLISPTGTRSAIALAQVVDERELWLATVDGLLWKGRWPSGRIARLTPGLPETCIQQIVRSSPKDIWLLGCQSTLSHLDSRDRLTALDGWARDWNSLPLPFRNIVPDNASGIWAVGTTGLVQHSRTQTRIETHASQQPFGGRLRTCTLHRDTLWCSTERTISWRAPKNERFQIDTPEWGDSPADARVLLSSPWGLLAGGDDGFWLRDTSGWKRPEWLEMARQHAIWKAAVRPGTPAQLVWWDGRALETAPFPGQVADSTRWIPPFGNITDLAWGPGGMVHIANGAWNIWNPRTNTVRTWDAGLGLTAVYAVLPESPFTTLAGEGGVVRVRSSAYLPP